MKLLFIILAHNQPEQLLELAAALAAAASDGRVIIHYDAHAKPDDYALLRESLKGNPRVAFTKRRVHCIWGDYSLVEATLLALAEARAQGREYDHVLLLSGSCLPCRPIKQLERYLTENPGMEFIEADGPEWPIDGLREERYTTYTVFPPLTRPFLEKFSLRIQRWLGIKRRLPAGIATVRFGSQWWCLTWKICLAILDFLERNPAVERFYRKTWFPDEMFFSTLVCHLTEDETNARYNLTHYQFTDYGKPIVFYDDHGDYPFSLNKFFYRKVSTEAKTLRRRSLAQACEPDNGETLEMIGRPNQDYEIKIKAQMFHPVPGHMYYQDQLVHEKTGVITCVTKPYVVVCGSLRPAAAWDVANLILAQKGVKPDTPLRPQAEPYVVLCDSPEAALATLAAMDLSVFEPLGRPFMPDVVDFGQGRESFHGLKKNDAAIRDLAPALYFARIIRRSEKIPVFLWMPGDNQVFMDIVSTDSRGRLREIRQW